MNQSTFEAFSREAKAEGYDEILERTWPPAAVTPTHTHPFAVRARVVAGEMWLTVGEDTRRLLPGDTFTLERDVRHSERYGAEGATYWVARRN